MTSKLTATKILPTSKGVILLSAAALALGLALSPANAAAPFQTGHRIAVSHDGNSWDKDDWGAAPLMLAIIAQFGHKNALVYFDYNCNVVNNNSTWVTQMHNRVMAQANNYAYDPNLFYNIRGGEQAAAETKLKNEILASTSTNRLWILMAGPPDTIYNAALAAKNVDPSKLPFCTIISHSPWNNTGNNGADCNHDLADILALVPGGAANNIQVDHIPNQNTYLNTKQDKSPWFSFRDSPDIGERYIWDAEVNSNGTLIIGRMDYSDAGMGYYLFTGVEDVRPNNRPPHDLATLFAGSSGGSTTISFNGLAEDGWVLESTETSGVGGSNNGGGLNLIVGDNATRQQFRAFVSFNTASIPDGATITAATLKLKRTTGAGSVTSGFGTLQADIKTGTFGAAGIENTDFVAPATFNGVATFNIPTINGDLAIGALNANGRSAINKTGTTQFRILFTIDDDNDGTADHVDFGSGNNAGNVPVFEVTYQ